MPSSQLDLLLWSDRDNVDPHWVSGKVGYLGQDLQSASETLTASVQASSAEYVLLWAPNRELPDLELVEKLVASGVDLAHCGLMQGTGNLLPSLQLVIQDWSMINSPVRQASSNWRLGLDAALVRRELLLRLGGLDTAFRSREAAGLELGYRCLRNGALVEYRPELWTETSESGSAEPPSQDLYTFLLRHYGLGWARYVALRISLSRASWISELRSLRDARRICAAVPRAQRVDSPVWFDPQPPRLETLERTAVSVIIPTLGRYSYVANALHSMQRQTVKPREVIVVDQNPAEARRPEAYLGYEDLNLRIIWQNERGQSLARNTGLAAATSPYVFLFDDDSVAHDDLIEAHLRYVVNGRFQVSTGVAYPPPPNEYRLPARFRYPRVAQTFDTGNSLLPLVTAKELGGLDRNYDYGPGTDLDFGTRLYLAGLRIVHNPEAIRIHFKAPTGGLRVYNAHKYNTDAALLTPFPAITQSYYGLRYLSKQQRRERTLLQFATSKVPVEFRRGNSSVKQMFKTSINFGGTCLLLPIKWYFSKRKAGQLLEKGVRLGVFESKPKAIEMVAGQAV